MKPSLQVGNMKDPIKTGRRRKYKTHALVPNFLKTANCFFVSTQHFLSGAVLLTLSPASVISEKLVTPQEA